MTRGIRIGRLAQLTGTTPATIRFYEDAGLLPRTQRGWGGQRVYSDDEVRRLTFIRRCREIGFSVAEVGRLVEWVGADLPCSAALDLAKDHLVGIRRKLDELRVLEREIASMVQMCDQSCSTGPAADCLLLAQLSHSREPSQTAPCCSGANDKEASARK